MIVALEGSYRQSTRPDLGHELEALATSWNAVIDVTQVLDPDPGMLAQLLTLSQSRRRAGLPPLTLVASHPTDAVWKVFDLLGVAMNCRFTGLTA